MKYNNMMKDIFDEVVDNDGEEVLKDSLLYGEYYVFTCFNSDLNQQANWYIPYSVPVEEAEKTIIEKCSVYVR